MSRSNRPVSNIRVKTGHFDQNLLRRYCQLASGKPNSAAIWMVPLYTATILAQVTSFQATNAWARNSRFCFASRL